MKDALRAAGLPVARHRLLAGARDAEDFAEAVGFPMVVKPPAGVGAQDTARVRSLDALVAAVRKATGPVLAEEMLVGREHSLETVTVGGAVRAWSSSRYLPGCLEALETPWIQWACVLPRDLDAPVYERARAMGAAAIEALGFGDGMTHMEWFERADGSLAIGEIAARPPGPQLLQMTGLVHDVRPLRAWARAEIDGAFEGPWARRHAAGTAFVRGVGRGRVAAVTGVHATWEAIHPWLVEAKLPTVGKRKVTSYEGDGYVVVRADTTEKARELLGAVADAARPLRRVAWPRGPPSPPRPRHHEAGAPAAPRLDPRVAVVLPRHLAHDREPEARPRAAPVGPVERFEHRPPARPRGRPLPRPRPPAPPARRASSPAPPRRSPSARSGSRCRGGWPAPAPSRRGRSAR